MAVGHELFRDHDSGSRCQLCSGEALGGVHALDLDRLHLHETVLAHLHLGLGVHDAAAVPIAASIVLFHVLHMGISADVETVESVMAAVAVAAVVDAAACHDGHVAVVPDIEIIVHHLRQAALA